MSSLHSLIRLHQWRLDEKRRALADLEALSASLAGQIGRLDSEIISERQAATLVTNNPASTMTLGNYMKAADQRREKLKASLRQITSEVGHMRDEINEAFQTLKRFEVVRDDRSLKATLRNQRLEMATIDDVAIAGFDRKRRSKDQTRS